MCKFGHYLMRGALMLTCLAWASLATASVPTATDLDRVVRSVCAKDAVFLGEDGEHAGAATIAVKLQLAQRLVAECGFKGLVFENQFYDMLDYQRAATAGHATRQQLASAFSAKWAWLDAYAPVLDWLHRQASAGRVLVAGMDPQSVDAGSRYAPDQLPGVLTAALAGERRTQCKTAIDRHEHWDYDDAHPFDDAELNRMRACLAEVGAGAADKMGADARDMVASYASYLKFVGNTENHIALRDRSMFDNLERIRARWPKGTRVLIWGATVHAVKNPIAGHRTTGSYLHERLGPKAATIGFTALAGSFGSMGGSGAANPLQAAPAGSLEARAFADDSTHAWVYLDAAQLKAMGEVPSRVLSYRSAPKARNWADLLDGIIVLREERAAARSP